MLNERPIFVIGAPRSGTTLLRYSLCAHPRIYIPPESNFFLRFLPLPVHQPLSQEKAVRLVKDVLNYKVFFRDWRKELPDPDTFVLGLADLKPATLLNTLYKEYACQYSAGRWGDKSPIYSDNVAGIAALFPTAQFVHIIRDGRDVALSMLKAYRGIRFFYVDLCYASLSWSRRVKRARCDGAELGPDCYFELKYEELTAAPDKTLKNLCNYLGETFVPEMLTPYQVAAKQFHSRGIHNSTRKPFNTQSVGRWKKKMSLSDRRLFHALAGDVLFELGYESVGIGPLSLGERIRLAALRTKYMGVETVRRALQKAGVVHPAVLATKLTKDVLWKQGG